MQPHSLANILQLLSNPSILIVLAGCILIAVQTSAIGAITVLRKQSLIGDAIAHAILPGICLAFLLTGEKSTLFFLIGAGITGWLGLTMIQWISSHTKIKKDASTGIVLSVFFGFGILLMTYIQQSGNGQQSGLDGFLLGKASAMLPQDIFPLLISCCINMFVIYALKKEVILLIFDKEFAAMSGLPLHIMHFLLNVILIASIVTGIIALGAILIGSILIIPCAIARFWRESYDGIVRVSMFSAIFSTVCGVLLTVFFTHIPTGPMIVLMLSLLFCMSAFLAPKKGIISRAIVQRKHHRQTIEDNILKYAYHHLEKSWPPNSSLPKQTLIPTETIYKHVPEFKSHIKQLQSRGFAKETPEFENLCITKEGLLRGMKITRLHRLWEAYLTHAAKFDIDHIHDDAESIEHILTPELEQQLQALLGDPAFDPHGEQIPPSHLL